MWSVKRTDSRILWEKAWAELSKRINWSKFAIENISNYFKRLVIKWYWKDWLCIFSLFYPSLLGYKMVEKLGVSGLLFGRYLMDVPPFWCHFDIWWIITYLRVKETKTCRVVYTVLLLHPIITYLRVKEKTLNYME